MIACLEHLHGILQPYPTLLEQSTQFALAKEIPQPLPILLRFNKCMYLVNGSGKLLSVCVCLDTVGLDKLRELSDVI
jgi:hypothetical protein